MRAFCVLCQQTRQRLLGLLTGLLRTIVVYIDNNKTRLTIIYRYLIWRALKSSTSGIAKVWQRFHVAHLLLAVLLNHVILL